MLTDNSRMVEISRNLWKIDLLSIRKLDFPSGEWSWGLMVGMYLILFRMIRKRFAEAANGDLVNDERSLYPLKHDRGIT